MRGYRSARGRERPLCGEVGGTQLVRARGGHVCLLLSRSLWKSVLAQRLQGSVKLARRLKSPKIVDGVRCLCVTLEKVKHAYFAPSDVRTRWSRYRIGSSQPFRDSIV